MDPISASCFSLHLEENAKAILEEQKQEEQFSAIIVSCKSLSYYEGKKFKAVLPQILAVAIAATFHIVVGMSLAYSAILLPQLEESQNVTGSIQVTKTEGSWIASVLVIFTPAGALVAGVIMDAIGRLNMLKLASIPCVLGNVLIAMATNVPMILSGRILLGIGSAWATSPAIVYITEIAKADLRGSLISMAPGFASLGMVLVYLKGWFLDWRLVAWLTNIYVVVPAILIMFIPESPAWLVSKGRIEQARKSLEWINRFQPQPEHKSESFAEMQLAYLQKEHMIKKEQEAQSLGGNGVLRKLKMFARPTACKPLVILTGLFFFQQFSGIYITLFYAVTFFKDIGSTINPYLASVFIGTVRFVMSIANTWFMRRFRRRTLIAVSCAGMAVCMCVSALFTKWIQDRTTTHTWVPVLMLLLYVVASMLGLLSIPWTMTAELFPLEIRGVAHSISYSLAQLLMFASIQCYYDLTNLVGGSSGLQYFFAAVSLGALLYSFIFLPETHRKKLKDIEAYFVDNTAYYSLTCCKPKSNAADNRQRKPIVRNPRVASKHAKMPKGEIEKILLSRA
ncbi:hypothetical protein PPYR_02901 [Photinus pyralis]|uniref:Major facilitator superfamily (MFS) profile domain-containing protein n=2 Tax=Photinus pyralis TaxID=7054 RepID=A0A5N4A1D1_PHOPY|nr:facilitated trehalose transporter Tret1-2 homolog isoform X2 [Photinus pyralis]XP_031331291.1 facilitated trehalose transporter Tret1-2 homolog isoform X2 [Photinus pyralis]XP_031331292.1 facilitated trehalose transporter Tret1-2 homolog isoform X2 [Photinus pyralis]XP_031331293.1 facilitated trehalose transporter Tret1-2 homolog isoform X2 [Photinus pyralis]XP_031331294.1 facilitated trehalose transporter Tret1-2 homolog isoform X2 [Photinus pyralis]KAB0791101.1 hypothetical protein PPYR_0